MGSLLETPLLIWVDDHAASEPAAELISHAKEVGVHVHVFETTIDAQAWIDHITLRWGTEYYELHLIGTLHILLLVLFYPYANYWEVLRKVDQKPEFKIA